MQHTLAQIIALVGLASSAVGQARVVITEIMYNPNSNEKKGETEWVEIANVGSESLEMKDWRLDDEDKAKWGKFSCTLAPGGVAVLINGDCVKEEQFRAAWDITPESGDTTAKPSYQVIPVKWSRISNSPSATDEILQLRNDRDEAVCEVKQQGEWPSCKKPDGPSIWLSDLKATNLSDGKLWRRSENGKDGAHHNKQTSIFDGVDVGSPGFVPGLTPAPANMTSSGAPAPTDSTKTPTKTPETKTPETKTQDKPAGETGGN